MANKSKLHSTTLFKDMPQAYVLGTVAVFSIMPQLYEHEPAAATVRNTLFLYSLLPSLRYYFDTGKVSNLNISYDSNKTIFFTDLFTRTEVNDIVFSVLTEYEGTPAYLDQTIPETRDLVAVVRDLKTFIAMLFDQMEGTA